MQKFYINKTNPQRKIRIPNLKITTHEVRGAEISLA